MKRLIKYALILKVLTALATVPMLIAQEPPRRVPDATIIELRTTQLKIAQVTNRMLEIVQEYESLKQQRQQFNVDLLNMEAEAIATAKLPPDTTRIDYDAMTFVPKPVPAKEK